MGDKALTKKSSFISLFIKKVFIKKVNLINKLIKVTIFFTRINLRIILKVRYAFIKKRITWDENGFFLQ